MKIIPADCMCHSFKSVALVSKDEHSRHNISVRKWIRRKNRDPVVTTGCLCLPQQTQPVAPKISNKQLSHGLWHLSWYEPKVQGFTGELEELSAGRGKWKCPRETVRGNFPGKYQGRTYRENVSGPWLTHRHTQLFMVYNIGSASRAKII